MRTQKQGTFKSRAGESVRFFLYSAYHGKDKPVGSDFIRAVQAIKYWDEADLYKYGENPEALIFMKVFIAPDYKFQAHFKGIKILDICDPMWLEDYDVVETCNAMDAVTCPTEGLANFIRQFHKNVIIIPDRFDIDILPEPKKHTKKAKSVVWFGYSHNAELLKPAIKLIDELSLKLILIANDDPFPHRHSDRMHSYHEWYTFIKYNEETFYEELQKADFAILPKGFRPEDRFKSNNKTVKANLAGLPVAVTADEVRHYMEAKNRRKWFDENYDIIKSDYDIRKSVAEYKEVIDEVKRSKTQSR